VSGATLTERLHAHLVEAEDGCLLWSGALRADGYGLIFDPRRGHRVGVHQVAWELAHRRRLPQGKVVRQSCGRPTCANPEHLRLMSRRVLARRVLPGPRANLAKTHCSAGHPLKGENLYRWRGQRHCRACHRERERERYHRLKAAG
jgi:hypothetical protein